MCKEIEKILLESTHKTAVKIGMRMLSSGKLTIGNCLFYWLAHS